LEQLGDVLLVGHSTDIAQDKGVVLQSQLALGTGRGRVLERTRVDAVREDE